MQMNDRSTTESLPEVLDQALARLKAGESVEACLSAYPQHARDLEPLLRTGNSLNVEAATQLPPEMDEWLATGARDFAALAELAEHNCLKMHAAALAAKPPLVYWNGATVECLHAVRRLRAGGVPVFFTIDAGPQVKAICLGEARPRIEAALREVPGVLDVLSSRLGPGAEQR